MRIFNKLSAISPLLALIIFTACKSNEPITKQEIEKTVISGLIEGAVFTPDHNIAYEPLSGVNILVVDTYSGTVSDTDGTFRVETEKPFPLELKVSYAGYNTQIIQINAPSTRLTIRMKIMEEELEEIVIESADAEAPRSKHERLSKTSTIIVDGDAVHSPAMRVDMAAGRESTSVRIKPDGVKNPKAGQITAAEWNDLYNWNDWKELLNNQDYNEMQTHWNLFPRSRYSVFVKNIYELPLQDIRVDLLAKSGEVLWSARTDNAGRAELWADINSTEKSFDAVDARIVVDNKPYVVKDLKTVDEGVNHFDIKTECSTAPFVDVFFAVDATGSMSDEINYLQSELKDVITRSLASNTNLKLRLGSVFYRDSSDNYITRTQPLAEDAQLTLDFIGAQGAAGGGDYPEAVDAALDEALAQDWSENAVARIVFLLLDAPPHHNPTILAKIQDQVADAAREGIKIIPITASGINRQTEFLMKFMAIATNGTYVFITDHSGIGNPHLDPVVQDYEIEKLNDLLVRLLYHYTKSNGCNANEPNVEGITFFPNPARNFVNINTDKPIRILKVLSNSGKLVQTKTDIETGETKINLEGLVDGVYTIQCSGDGMDFSQPVVVINR